MEYVSCGFPEHFRSSQSLDTSLHQSQTPTELQIAYLSLDVGADRALVRLGRAALGEVAPLPRELRLGLGLCVFFFVEPSFPFFPFF